MNLDIKIKDKIVERLKHINPAKILLFGSFAYGNPTKDSDIDLLIIKDTLDSKIREMIEARRALKGISIPFDTIVQSQEEFEFYKTQVNTISYEADKKGIVIYERG
ncbi:MAG: nucleotidyltransferase domain-containing protein [Nitrospirae bacterium]|nr:nucleotidyltransferase domain-containing protein [Nitrospirota bacterium]MBF0592640.1 nucleotidyltransferase domain-containing protein [Nitrospirota bacterium]